MSSAAKLDTEFLEELLDGDREFAVELFQTYHDSADTSLDDAEQLLLKGDADNAYRPFHTLKGASASVGLVGMRELAREFELKAKEGRLDLCREGLDDLRIAVGEAKGALQGYLETL